MSDLPESPRGLAEHLNIEVTEATPSRCVATMDVSQVHQQPHGIMHGGSSLALAETVASVGAKTACREERQAFGMEINANHLRPFHTGQLTATAKPEHVGQTSQVWSVEIADKAGKLICVSRCTMAIRPSPQP